MKIIVTGGAGFIGSAVCRHLLSQNECEVLVIDSLTYAASPATLAPLNGNKNFKFEQADICDAAKMDAIIASYKPDAVMHLAAESHVDRSIDAPDVFMQTNIIGTYTLLQAARKYWQTLDQDAQNAFRFLHVSTDEVYGSLGETGYFTEETSYDPSSPYSASKAASDHIARAWQRTFDLPVIISNCSNNYGPYQFPEKLIPVLILNAIAGRSLPIYGNGKNIRDWLYVEDHADALYTILRKGRVGEVYNIGGNAEETNINICQNICSILNEALPDNPHSPFENLIEYVEDRPGHDLRYAIDASKLKSELGWEPTHTLSSGLNETVKWYLENTQWWQGTMDQIAAQRRGNTV